MVLFGDHCQKYILGHFRRFSENFYRSEDFRGTPVRSADISYSQSQIIFGEGCRVFEVIFENLLKISTSAEFCGNSREVIPYLILVQKRIPSNANFGDVVNNP